MKKLFFIVLISMLGNQLLYSQVAINNSGASADSKAMLDVQSTTLGILIPRMTTVQRNLISSPAYGLLVFDNSTDSFWYYSSDWIEIRADNINGLADNDGDTQIRVEKSTDEDIIRFDVEGDECFNMNGPKLGVKNSGKSVFIGDYAGHADDLSDNKGVMIGYYTGYANTTGYYNTAIGYYSFNHNIAGHSNTAYGAYSLFENIYGDGNTAVGWGTLLYTTSDKNSAFGSHALYYNSSGFYNTAVGYEALYSNTTGDYNTAVGNYALTNNISGLKNTAIGYNSGPSSTYHNLTFATAVGYGTKSTASYQVRLGNNLVTSIGGYSSWSNVSDGRFKKNVKPNVPGLDFILKLKPVTYQLDVQKLNGFLKENDSITDMAGIAQKEKIIQTGFIAQDVEKAAQSLGFDFSGVDMPKNKNDHYGLRYAEFVVPLVKAVQEQQQMINEQKQLLELQNSAIELLIKRLEVLEKSK